MTAIARLALRLLRTLRRGNVDPTRGDISFASDLAAAHIRGAAVIGERGA